MERVYEVAGKRTKRAVSSVQLATLDWDKQELECFQNCKQALVDLVTLAHRDEDLRLCIYTDALDTNWASIVTQVPHEELPKPHKDQRHSPLAFCSGRFNATQLGWSTLEKEGFAIMATVERMHWLVATAAGFDLFTDHNNLIFLFDPLSLIPDLNLSSTRKVLRWAVRLSSYSYTCFHISGLDNVWAEMLTRWTAPSTVRRLINIPVLPSTNCEEFCWPTANEIAQHQHKNDSERPPNLEKIDGIWQTASGVIWIPEAAENFQLRLCIIAHSGPSGHREKKATLSSLLKHYHWNTARVDVHSFVQGCIHCLSTTGGENVPRPFGPALHGTKPNDLLQFDYIDIGQSRAGPIYILMLRDDHADYKWFFATPGTSAENAALAIVDWCAAAFSVPLGLMSNGPSHFKNDTIRLLTKALRVPHHFTLPYTPLRNGAVERLGKEVVRTFRALIFELQMDFKEWADLLPVIQSVLKNASSPHRRNIPPVTAFLGMAATSPIGNFIRTTTSATITVSEAQAERCINVIELQKHVAELHPLVQNSLQRNRKLSRLRASKGVLPNFALGDFVLVAREEFFAGEKLALRWRGPRRITQVLSDYVFQVKDLRNGTLQEVHGSRLKFYHDASLNNEAIVSHVLSSETGMPVGRLLQLVETKNGLFVLVRWKGLDKSEDSLEPLVALYEDVPAMVQNLLRRKNIPSSLAKKARDNLGF